eukprot:TRINITY_DN7773_c0_g1_i7.p2 TRINITY_DN7773_c0_g1~~TRINITY_DN7773_c0_g1_i7.p2  ORF type:complete len:162 (-),score=52.05 TRINITY_DN7773_c0_g1_i7:155-640(-)
MNLVYDYPSSQSFLQSQQQGKRQSMFFDDGQEKQIFENKQQAPSLQIPNQNFDYPVLDFPINDNIPQNNYNQGEIKYHEEEILNKQQQLQYQQDQNNNDIQNQLIQNQQEKDLNLIEINEEQKDNSKKGLSTEELLLYQNLKEYYRDNLEGKDDQNYSDVD